MLVSVNEGTTIAVREYYYYSNARSRSCLNRWTRDAVPCLREEVEQRIEMRVQSTADKQPNKKGAHRYLFQLELHIVEQE